MLQSLSVTMKLSPEGFGSEAKMQAASSRDILGQRYTFSSWKKDDSNELSVRSCCGTKLMHVWKPNLCQLQSHFELLKMQNSAPTNVNVLTMAASESSYNRLPGTMAMHAGAHESPGNRYKAIASRNMIPLHCDSKEEGRGNMEGPAT